MRPTTLTLLSLLLPAVMSVGAQELQAPVFRDTVDVRVLHLEVVVVDERGKRVKGLLPEDFRLLVDGEQIEIDYFTEVAAGRATSPEGEASGGTSPATSQGEAVGRSYVVFIDDFFSMPEDRDAVVRSIMDDLDQLSGADQMAVVAWDGQDLTMLSHWSSSSTHLRRVLNEALARPARGRDRIMEQRPVGTPNTVGMDPSIAQNRRHRTGAIQMSDMDLQSDWDTVPDVESMRELDLQRAVERLERQMGAATSAAAATLRTFSSAPGRKVMMLLSGGWPHSPAELLADNDPTQLLDFWTDAEALFGRLPAAANRLGFTIYSVDVPDSTMTGNAISATERDVMASTGRSQIEQERLGGANVGLAGGADVRQSGQMRQTLELLSGPTGGKVLIGSDRAEALALVAEDTSSYYWIGFTPPWKEDDRARQVRLEVLREGLRGRTRSSYLDLSPERSVAMLLESALLFEASPNQHTIPIRIGKAKRSRRGTSQIPVTVAIPVDSLVFLRNGREFVADLSLHVALRDSDGNMSGEIRPTPFKVRLKSAPPAGTYVPYETKLQVRNRPHRLVLAVHDAVGGATLTGAGEIVP